MNIRIWKALKRQKRLTKQLIERIEKMTVEFDNLTKAVKANTDVIASAVIAFNGLADQLRAAKDDPVKVQALADELTASSTALANAIVANTPTPSP